MTLTGIAKAIVDLVIGVFTTVAPAIGTALVDTVDTLVWDAAATTPALTNLATICLVFAAFSIGVSLLYKVFSLIRFKRNTRA